MPKHMEKTECKNCDHTIYYQHDHWAHYTRKYRVLGLPYTTQKCYAEGEALRNWWVDGVQQTCCGCMNPEPRICDDCGEVLEKFVNDDDMQYEWYCANKKCPCFDQLLEIDISDYENEIREHDYTDSRLPENNPPIKSKGERTK